MRCIHYTALNGLSPDAELGAVAARTACSKQAIEQEQHTSHARHTPKMTCTQGRGIETTYSCAKGRVGARHIDTSGQGLASNLRVLLQVVCHLLQSYIVHDKRVSEVLQQPRLH